MGWSHGGHGRYLPLAVDQGFEHQRNVHELPLPVVMMLDGRTRLLALRAVVAEVTAVPRGDLEFRIYREMALAQPIEG